MFYSPQLYAQSNTPTYMRSNQTLLESILRGLKREASAIELYDQLAQLAPNQLHRDYLNHAVAEKKAKINQFQHLYMNLTGTQAMYQTQPITFHSYRDGLLKAYHSEVEGVNEYYNTFMQTEHPQVRNIFSWVLSGEQVNAERFRYLNESYNRSMDYGPNPFAINIDEATKKNDTFRTALWTGKYLQVTLMSINPGESIGLEIHPNLDQFLRIEQGQGIIQMGDRKDQFNFEEEVFDDYAIVIPAGKWHNLTNTGNQPLKLYSIYAPPQHPYGTVHKTKAEAMAAEEHH
ncbi:cupin domain-containing protein [Cytobacillus sp. FJAT-54145]|uniref:Cupin domain-containing protein n=1 Tax=Cytobacillus spartinae TaxID=3299023 RepID=A0ABW6K6V0_9BACI